MPTCLNCGAHVSRDYARVFAPTGLDGPRVCPQCPDRVRSNGRVRAARSVRKTGSRANAANNDDNAGAAATDRGSDADGDTRGVPVPDGGPGGGSDE